MTMESEGKGRSGSHEGVVKEEEGGGKEKAKEEEEEEDDQFCTTPTGSGNRIPEVQKCPPAPRKRRRSSPPWSSTLTRRSFTADHELHFFEDTRPEEVDAFFRSISVNEIAKLRNGCRSV